MLETEHEQFEEPEYPSFPVVFQRELENQFETGPVHSRSQVKKTITVPENDAYSLMRMTEVIYETKYPHLFSQPVDSMTVQAFFREYLPIDENFVHEMKKDIDSLKIARMGNNKIFVGSWVDGKCTGKSIIIFKNGNLYEGELHSNKRNGNGVYIHVNTGWYKGNFKDDIKNGEGIQVFYHRCAYKGSFLNGLRHEKGLYVDEEKNIYEGAWKLGIMHGKGTLKTQKSIFTGTFVNFLKHGSGDEQFSNGDTYKGEYQNGRFEGIGSYEWKSEEASYQGSFKNGLRHGMGKWQKGETKYNGAYVEGLKEGYGELYYPSGNFYKGNFIEDKKDGYGEMFWTDSSFYKGEWKNGNQNGKGQIYLVGGDIISGIFENSMLVQAMPSIYEKQMEISNMNIHDMFGSKPKVEKHRTRILSENKHLPKKRLSKIPESSRKKNGNPTISNKLYFKSPEKSEHSDGDHRECTRCMRRLQNFQQKLKKDRNHNNNHSHSKEHAHHHHHHHH